MSAPTRLLAAALLALPALGCTAASERPEPAPGAREGANAPRPAPSIADDAAQPAEAPPESGGDGAAASGPAPVTVGSAVSTGTPVARVGGRAIDVGQLLDRLLQHESPTVHAHLSRLIAAELARAEAERIGLQLDPAAVEARVAALRGELDRKVRAEGDGLSTEEWIRAALGLDPGTYLRRLREETVEQMLAERVIRAWLMANGWARLRLIVVDSEEAADAVRAALDAGEGFADVARAHSLDATASDGGLVPALVKTEASPLSRLAFQTPLGKVGGPLEDQGAWLFFVVEERFEPALGDWSTLGLRVEASLAESPVLEDEFRQWELFMERRYEVDFRPFLELMGQPAE